MKSENNPQTPVSKFVFWSLKIEIIGVEVLAFMMVDTLVFEFSFHQIHDGDISPF